MAAALRNTFEGRKNVSTRWMPYTFALAAAQTTQSGSAKRA